MGAAGNEQIYPLASHEPQTRPRSASDLRGDLFPTTELRRGAPRNPGPMDSLHQRLTPDDLLQRLAKAPVAYVWVGTPGDLHGPHLPLGSDCCFSRLRLYSKLSSCVGGVVLPPLFFLDAAAEVGGTAFSTGWTLSSSSGTRSPGRCPGAHRAWTVRLAEVMLEQLHRAGVRIVVGHGHGPSTDLFVSEKDGVGSRV